MLDGSDPAQVREAARQLAQGRLVAFPTETVYGLGARADDDAAVAGIFSAKGRPVSHPLIVHVQDVQAAQVFAQSWPAAAQALAQRFWPGPVTVIVPRRLDVAFAAAGGHPTIGLRCPDHPVARALMHEAALLGVPGIAGPSANRFGRVSATRAEHVVQEFGADLTILDGGPCPVGIESAIVDCSGPAPALLRPGTVSASAIREALGQMSMALRAAGPDAAAAPGTLASHYAPTARVRLMSAQALEGASRPGFSVGVYARVLPAGLSGAVHAVLPISPEDVARELFSVLRRFDAQGVQEIWVQQPPTDSRWDAVRDRLIRAAAG